jgi:hypothetical protein
MSGVNNIRSSVISPTNGILPTLIIDFWVNIIVKRTLRNGKREGNFIHFIYNPEKMAQDEEKLNKNTTHYVLEANTNNVHKTWALIQTTEEEPNIVFMWKL